MGLLIRKPITGEYLKMKILLQIFKGGGDIYLKPAS